MEEIRIESFLYPYVRFVNACPGISGADFYRGNTIVSPNLQFGCFSSYSKLGRGMQEFTVRKPGDKDSIIASISIPAERGEVYTVALVHSDGGAMLYGISEPTGRGNTDYGNIRVCHLSPVLSGLDISVKGYDILCGIDYLEVSRYICMSPDVYDFVIKDSASKEKVLSVPNQKVIPGGYNTLYIMGQNGEKSSFMGVFTVDAASYTGYYL